MESSIAWRFFNIARRRAIFTPCISCFATIQSFAKAACFTACLLISDCLDFFISSDRWSSRINLWRKLFLLQLFFTLIFAPAYRKYFVASLVFYFWVLFGCIFVAFDIMDFSIHYNDPIFSGIFHFRASFCSIFSLDNVCWVFEFWRMAAQ